MKAQLIIVQAHIKERAGLRALENVGEAEVGRFLHSKRKVSLFLAKQDKFNHLSERSEFDSVHSKPYTLLGS
jgi:hypothetical protein